MAIFLTAQPRHPLGIWWECLAPHIQDVHIEHARLAQRKHNRPSADPCQFVNQPNFLDVSIHRERFGFGSAGCVNPAGAAWGQRTVGFVRM